MSDLAYERIEVADARSLKSAFRPMDVGGRSISATAFEKDQDSPQDRYDAGYEAGLREAREAFETEREGLTRLIVAAEALQPEPSEELAVLIAEAVERLVAQIVGTTPIDSVPLMERATAAASLVGECDNARTMWLHPEDIALIGSSALPLTTMADPDAERGSIRIDCSAGWIEAGTALHLDALRAQLGLREATA